MRADPADFEAAIGYRFSNKELLVRALTHSSLVNETASGERDSESLEFLGDAILGFVISEELFTRYPEYREGQLSMLKAHLVSASYLISVASRLDIGRFLLLGRGEERSGGRTKRTLLVDALEAVIGAVYLDGGLMPAKWLVNQHVLADFGAEDQDLSNPTDFKNALQELAMSRKLPRPTYILVGESGPEHKKLFAMEVRMGKLLTAQGQAHTKKAAAQLAARAVYERLIHATSAEPVES